ncbi:MAG: hypothetical protein MO847_09000 [Candidatus Protistobacter heckmanni]|nr:hypothetical protein [Candidatus Protistobacter heckmanni]
MASRRKSAAAFTEARASVKAEPELPGVIDHRPDLHLQTHARLTRALGEQQGIVAQGFGGADVDQQRRQAGEIAARGRGERIRGIGVAEIDLGQRFEAVAAEHRIELGIRLERDALAGHVGRRGEERRGVGQRFARGLERQHQGQGEVAAGRIARDHEARAGRGLAHFSGENPPGLEHVVRRGGKGMLGREPVVGRADLDALQRERRRDGAVRARRAADKAAAVDVEEDGVRMRARALALHPLGRHAVEHGRRVAHAARPGQRPGEDLADLEGIAHVAQPGLDHAPHDPGCRMRVKTGHRLFLSQCVRAGISLRAIFFQ